jgi:imidazolonepropionase-like amidohydrolase
VADLLIRRGLLFDGTASAPRANDLLVIEDGRILRLGPDGSKPSGTLEIDAAELAILPGFVDLHVHFGAPVGNDFRRLRPFVILDYLRHRPRHRAAFLRAGITTIRSVGDVVGTVADVLSLKRRAASGTFQGPRVFAAGPLFTAPGGHPASTIYRRSAFLIAHATRQVASVERARSEVRDLAKGGVDGIKAVYDTAGGRLPRLSLEVLRALVDEARLNGLWVAVHTGSATEVRQAVEAGANTIEHGATDGTLLDPETLGLIRSRGVTYVPTLVVVEALSQLASARRRPDQYPEEDWKALVGRMEALGPEPLSPLMANVRAANAAGVRIAAGTDAQGPRMAFGASLHREMELLVEAGLSPAQALRAATCDGAAALAAPYLGRLEVGAAADIVLVAGRPWERITDVRRIHTVILAGRIMTRASSPSD